eukprot:1194805-Prorocentrum_minimum.AAC.4
MEAVRASLESLRLAGAPQGTLTELEDLWPQVAPPPPELRNCRRLANTAENTANRMREWDARIG